MGDQSEYEDACGNVSSAHMIGIVSKSWLDSCAAFSRREAILAMILSPMDAPLRSMLRVQYSLWGRWRLPM